MATWGAFKAEVSALILKDSGETKWTDNDLLVLFRWATDALCQHTPYPKIHTFGPASQTVYAIPADVYGDLLDGSLLFYEDATGVRYQIAPPSVVAPKSDYQYQLAGGSLILDAAPGSAYTLKLAYYAYYPMPATDNDTIAIPQWSHTAVAYLMGAYALTSRVTSFALINQWKVKAESGTPMHNPAQALQEHYFTLAQGELARHKPLQRSYWGKCIRFGEQHF